MTNNLESAMIDGIRKTIYRFRTRPLNYFTESDIHSSLLRDILEGNSDSFLYRYSENEPEISLLHNEYPTNFRYKKSDLADYVKTSIDQDWEKIVKNTRIDKEHGDRGNYDVSILNSEFLKRMFEKPIRVAEKTDYKNAYEKTEIIKHIINKNIKYTLARPIEKLKEELLYAIEIKFIHQFNARNSKMLSGVIKDNAKLKLAKTHSDDNLKTISIVFCSSNKKKRSNKTEPVITKIKNYITERKVTNYDNERFTIPDGIINIFVESYFDKKSKQTEKPLISINQNAGHEDKKLAKNLAKENKTDLIEI